MSVSKIVLIGSLRSRIVIIISLMTIAVQLAIYAIVDRTNEDFHTSLEATMINRVTDIVPSVVKAEFGLLTNELQKIKYQLNDKFYSNGYSKTNDTIDLIARPPALNVENRHFILRDSSGSILYSEGRLAQNIPASDNPTNEPRLSGFFHDDQSFLTVTTDFEVATHIYSASVASSIEQNVLPAVEELAQVSAKVVRVAKSNRTPTSNALGDVQIAAFPEALIQGKYEGSRELNNLMTLQQTRLQILLASSLIIVLFLGMALARELTKPLQQLVEITKKIKNGDYSIKVPEMHRDEIGELAHTIDKMRQHVGEREDEILKLAYADRLTELPNRALFDDRLNNAVELGQRKGELFAVVILDMNRFKYINDVLGHESGDSVLKEVASRLKTTLRRSDTVARLGGDEFALVLQDVSDTRIMAAIGRIAAVFEAPVMLNNQPIDIGCSIGITKYPEHGEDASTLMRRADMAMYSAKRSDTVYAFYDASCEEHSETHLSLLSEIKRAIEKDELQLFFQPKVTLNDSSVLSVETLLRWQHPTRGLIPPDEFIPFAERTGAIKLITRWLIGKAIIQARSWVDQGLMIKMSINISARDLLDADFSNFVSERLKEHGAQASMFCMEITESALMEDPVKARRTVDELHQLGLSISIDDYGTGYSSLAYVKNLPVNELKIDREFIKNMIENKEDVAIVRSTIELGHNLGLKVVAEGIEREEEMQMLKDFGCDEAQGYLISKALSVSDMEIWISENRKLPTDFCAPPMLKAVGKNS